MDNQPNPQHKALIPYIAAFKNMFLTPDGEKIAKSLTESNTVGTWAPGRTPEEVAFLEGQRAMCRQLLNFRNLKEE